MSLLSRAAAAWRAFRNPRQRGFDATKIGRLYADWFAQATSSDSEIRNNFRRLIDRSRDLERNNDYMRGFLLACERNIIGAIKYDLRMDCGEQKIVPGKAPTWVADRAANALIENAWTEWGKKGTCTVCGKYSWRDVKRLLVRSVPRDGNFIARKIRGAAAGNRFGFALQLWEIDHLDVCKFEVRPDGSEIRFGIEYNALKRPVAYWLFASHPGDLNGIGYGTDARSTRFSAEEIYHVFVSERVEQSLGYPWIVSAITRLRQLGAFEEAAVIAARLGASKLGFLKQLPGPNGEMGEFTGPTNSAGNPMMEGQPGTFEALPQGYGLDSWNPEYPNIETGDFRKAMLRGVGTGVGMSYNTLGNDLESVNFSSARVGLFEEREGWKGVQMFFDESFYSPVFSDWLEASMMGGAVALPTTKMAKFNRPVFKARRWPFINPIDEINAAKVGIAMRLTSRRQVIEEGGGDVEEVFHDNKADEELAEEIDLSLAPPDPQPEAVDTTSTTTTTSPGSGGASNEEASPKSKAKKTA